MPNESRPTSPASLSSLNPVRAIPDARRPAHDSAALSLTVLQIGGSLSVEAGGMAAACASLANHLALAGVRVTAVSLKAPRENRNTWALDALVDHVPCKPVSRLGYGPGLPAALSVKGTPDVVHLHGLWRLHSVQAARYAKRTGAPVVLSTHGMVHETALDQRRNLKKIASLLWMDDLVHRAQCLHATGQQEVDEIGRFGYVGPIALIPWGIELPRAGPGLGDSPGPDRVIAYLGRLHPSKGLEGLLRAWARVENRGPWRLVLAGYDEGGYLSTLTDLVAALNLGDRVTFTGPVEGEARERFFARAQIMVLPSPAENFGFVVPEALVRGVPVITTRGTPWSALATERCGWWVADDEETLVSTLHEALGCAPATLGEMGERGRRFAQLHFSWDRVAREMIDLYGWLAGRRERPGFVHVTK